MPPPVGGTLDADSDEAYEYLYGPGRQRRRVPVRTAVAPVHRDLPSRPAPPTAHRWVADPPRREQQQGRREGVLQPVPRREPARQREQPRYEGPGARAVCERQAPHWEAGPLAVREPVALQFGLVETHVMEQVQAAPGRQDRAQSARELRFVASQRAGLAAALSLATDPARSLPAKRRRRRGSRVLAVGVLTGGVLGVVLTLHMARGATGGESVRLGWYGLAVVTLISAKLILSLLAAPARETPEAREVLQRHNVSGIITCRNEDPLAFAKCLKSILHSTRLPDSLTIIDDASDSPGCRRITRAFAPAFQARGVDYDLVVFRENLGKREGLAAGFRRAWDADVYLCIDSDTVLHREAIANALKPFRRRKVQATTGAVFAANRRTNLLTRLIDLRYSYAFLGERAAYSVMGSVLCACGSLALYRGPTIRKYLDDFLGQRFLGLPCTFGDDRRLTYYCLREGQVLLAPDALAWTLVPFSMKHFVRQQLRWSKSFFRESLWMLATVPPWRTCWWLTLVELSTWSGFTTALIYSVAVKPALTGHFGIVTYLISVLALSYARSGHYFEAEHPDLNLAGKLFTLAIAPLYGLIHVTLLLPLRLVALLTLRDNSWGTRKTVEVTS
jgi:hyaluronan synthase